MSAKTKEHGQELTLKRETGWMRPIFVIQGRDVQASSWFTIDPQCRTCGSSVAFQITSSGREEVYCAKYHLLLRLPEGARP